MFSANLSGWNRRLFDARQSSAHAAEYRSLDAHRAEVEGDYPGDLGALSPER